MSYETFKNEAGYQSKGEIPKELISKIGHEAILAA